MPRDGDDSRLAMVASTTLPQDGSGVQRFKLLLPRLDIPDFAGPGAGHQASTTLKIRFQDDEAD